MLREELKKGLKPKCRNKKRHILAAQEVASAASEAGMPLAEDASSLIETASPAFDASFASSGLLWNPGMSFLQSSHLVLAVVDANARQQ